MKSSIRKKLMVFSGVSVSLVLLLAFVAFFITLRTEPIIKDLLGRRVVELVNVGSVYALVLEAEGLVDDAVQAGDPSLAAPLPDMEAEIDSLLGEIQTSEIEEPEVAALYDQLVTTTPVVFDMMDALVTAAASDPESAESEEAAEQLDEYLSEEYDPALNDVMERREQGIGDLKAELDAIRARLTTLRTMLVVVTVAALIAGAVADRLLARPIVKAAAHLATAAESISRGDLDTEIDVNTGDEMESLANSLERMRESLKAAIERLRRRRE
jgi:methyl-accepting chemotaxis protein